MALLGLLRLATFASAIVFAIIVLGTSAAMIDWTTSKANGEYFKFSALALATSLLTILTLPAMLIIDFVRSGAITSMVVTELAWLFVLWVLWLASAADASNEQGLIGFTASCSKFFFSTLCSEFNVIQAFSFLAWIVLFLYSIALLVHAIIGTTRGHQSWTTSVRNGAFLAPPAAGAAAGTDVEKQEPAKYEAGSVGPTHDQPTPAPAPTTATTGYTPTTYSPAPPSTAAAAPQGVAQV